MDGTATVDAMKRSPSRMIKELLLVCACVVLGVFLVLSQCACSNVSYKPDGTLHRRSLGENTDVEMVSYPGGGSMYASVGRNQSMSFQTLVQGIVAFYGVYGLTQIAETIAAAEVAANASDNAAAISAGETAADVTKTQIEADTVLGLAELEAVAP